MRHFCHLHFSAEFLFAWSCYILTVTQDSTEAKYKLPIDWDGKLYVVISLTCNYEKFMVQLDMKGFLHAALCSFQHGNPKIGQESP